MNIFFSQFLYYHCNNQCYNDLDCADFSSVSVLQCKSLKLSREEEGEEEGVDGTGQRDWKMWAGRLSTSGQPVFLQHVGVLNSLETNKQAPHMHLMEAPQALDNTEAFQKSELHPRQITVQRAGASCGR